MAGSASSPRHAAEVDLERASSRKDGDGGDGRTDRRPAGRPCSDVRIAVAAPTIRIAAQRSTTSLAVGAELEHLRRCRRRQPHPRATSISPSPPSCRRRSRLSVRPVRPPCSRDRVLHQPPRLPRRRRPCARDAAPSASSTRLAGLEQVGTRLLPRRAVGVLLAAAELRFARRWPLLLRSEPRDPTASSSIVRVGHRRLRARDVALPLLHRGEQRVEAALARPGPAPRRRRASRASTPSRRAMARP